MKDLVSKIFAEIKKAPGEYGAYEDLFQICMVDGRHDVNRELREAVGRQLATGAGDLGRFFDLYKRSLLFDSPVDFDSYLLYIEINRPPKERFYAPRRRIMRKVAGYLQSLADGELDELFLSMPPRVGKTTILLFYLTWIMGRDSELSNLYSAYSDVITKALYNGVLEVLTDPVTYLWHDVFPEARIVGTNSADETLNLDRKKRYPSLTARSLYGTLNGACDCRGMLISDDLISGIEEAMNKDRLVSAWAKVDNNLIPRAKETAKILWCGTRWSMIDPIGVRLDLLQNDAAYRGRRIANINLPALNAEDESNFEYEYGVGFSTDYYRMRRASFERNNDIASWSAQYQGDPIEREGALFTPEGFRYYNGVLPEGDPDRVFMAVDPAFGGGDYVAAPVCYQYGEDLYVHDVVFDNGDKSVTQPLLADAITRNGVQAAQFEATRATEAYKEGVEAILKDRGVRLNITSKAAPTTTAKFQRIFDKAPDIRERMIFRENGCRDKPYSLFMQNVFAYKTLGKNKNDDAPDSLSMAIDMTRSLRKAEAVRRLF